MRKFTHIFAPGLNIIASIPEKNETATIIPQVGRGSCEE